MKWNNLLNLNRFLIVMILVQIGVELFKLSFYLKVCSLEHLLKQNIRQNT